VPSLPSLTALPSLPSGPDFLARPGAPAKTASATEGARRELRGVAANGGDDQFTAMMAARRARIDALKVEGPRMLRSGNPRRAAELCRAWVDLDLANAEGWRCLGRAQQALGQHQEALNAFRKAREHDPMDRSLDADVDSAQRAIVAVFLNRYRR
jgi:tetratricopeptide (TPR) repeat protein